MSTLQISLPRDAASAASARREARSFAREQHVGDDASLLLVVSELVANAVMHGAGPIVLYIVVTGRVAHVEVSDNGALAAPLALGPRDPHAIGGRGLRIVDVLTTAWGVDGRPGGKTVWVDLDLDGAPGV